MAMLANILSWTQDPVTKVTALGTTASSAAIAVTPHRPFIIIATGDFHLKGGATSAMAAAAATDFLFPGGVPVTLEAGADTAYLRVYNDSVSATVDVYVKVLGRT